MCRSIVCTARKKASGKNNYNKHTNGPKPKNELKLFEPNLVLKIKSLHQASGDCVYTVHCISKSIFVEISIKSFETK